LAKKRIDIKAAIARAKTSSEKVVIPACPESFFSDTLQEQPIPDKPE
jgi:hypothetical protein